MDLPDVGFRHFGVDLHFREVGRQHEEFRSAETGRDGLAYFRSTVHHHPINRGENPAAFQIHLGFFKPGFHQFQLGLGAAEIGLHLVEISDGQELFGDQLLFPLEAAALQVALGFGAAAFGPGLGIIGLIGGGVEFTEDIAFLHHGIEVHVELRDGAGNLGTDLDLDEGIEFAGGGHKFREIAPPDFHGFIFRRSIGRIFPGVVPPAAGTTSDE